MNRKPFAVMIMTATAILSVPLLHGQIRPAPDIVAEIKQAQGVDRLKDIEPEEVSAETLAELGEALMEVMVPDESHHEYMDRMMGGAGSESLEAMHQAIGYSYLTGDGGGPWPSRWGGMMSGGGPAGYGMMRGPGWNSVHDWTGTTGWVWGITGVLAVAVVVLIILLVTRSRHGKPLDNAASAREILARRYARGEISRDEYRNALHDLQ